MTKISAEVVRMLKNLDQPVGPSSTFAPSIAAVFSQRRIYDENLALALGEHVRADAAAWGGTSR